MRETEPLVGLPNEPGGILMNIAERHPTPGQISVLPDGRCMSASTRGKELHPSLESGAFDDPWIPEYLTVKYGRGRAH